MVQYFLHPNIDTTLIYLYPSEAEHGSASCDWGLLDIRWKNATNNVIDNRIVNEKIKIEAGCWFLFLFRVVLLFCSKFAEL